jgi:uncharacterized protein YeaO (DUF488 family)
LEQKTNLEDLKDDLKNKSIFEKVTENDGLRICVMRFTRKNYKYDLWLQDLAPGIKLLNDYKNKKISWDEYAKRYLDKIKDKEAALKMLLKLIRTMGTVTLLRAEKDDKYCHRRLLKEYVERRFFS